MIARTRRRGLAAISSPQTGEYDSISFTQYGLAFRTDVGWLNDIFGFDAIFRGETLKLYLPRQKPLASKLAGAKCMRAKASSVFLLKSVPEKMVKRPRFRTDEVVAQSGIYRVRHRKHRLPHEVTLLKDEQFPRCSKCRNAVVFELVRDVTFTDQSRERDSRIRLYELPVLEDGKQSAA